MRRLRSPIVALFLGVVLLAGLALLVRPQRDAPGAAEPARSPVTTTRPAGTVVPLPGQAEGITVEPATGLAAIALSNPPRLALVEPATARVRRTVALAAFARHLAPGTPGEVLVPAERANALARVQLRAPFGVTRTPVAEHPHDAALVAGAVVTTGEFADKISIIGPDGAERRMPTAEQPGGVAGDGDIAAVVAVRRFVLETHDIRRGVRLGRVPAGRGPTHIAGTGDGRVVVVDTRGERLLVFALRPRLRLLGRTRLPGAPYGIAVDRPRGRLWVTLTARNEVAELTLGRSLRLVRTLPTVRQPNGVAVDARSGRVLVVGRRPGRLQLIDP